MPAKARGLGRGLDTLLPKTGIRQVLVEDLAPSPLQPRSHVDRAAIAELASSIASKGILQPLLVRPSGDGFEIVAGERRFRAAVQAGLASVPVVVKKLDDRETLEIAIIENLQRENLNPVEEARAFQQLKAFGGTQDELAKSVGKSRSAVANALRLLKLPAAALNALEKGRISAGHARAILAQEKDDQTWAFEHIVALGLSVRQAEGLKRNGGATKKRSASDGRYVQLENEVSRQVGTKVLIKGGTKGRIELHFYSRDDLEGLLELLGYRP